MITVHFIGILEDVATLATHLSTVVAVLETAALQHSCTPAAR
jgi:hypothetical protein